MRHDFLSRMLIFLSFVKIPCHAPAILQLNYPKIMVPLLCNLHSLEILRFAQNDSQGLCHSERSEESLADL